jgi:hypothetical protein
MKAASLPEIAVLIPLHDARGDFVDHLRSWTDRQTFPRDRYQIIVASRPGDTRAQALVRGVLAPHDRLVESSSEKLWAMWNAAASAAESPWLVLAEGHCTADRRFLEVIVDAVGARPELRSVRIEERQIAQSRGGELCARWFTDLYADWSTIDQPRLNTAAIVIGRRVFEDLGGLDVSLGMFAHTMLAAALRERGLEVPVIRGATVEHMNTDTLAQHNSFVTSYTLGECRVRERNETAFCERHFGHDEVWNNRLRYRPEVARLVRSALLDAVRRKTTAPADLPWLLGELGRWAGPGGGVNQRVAFDKVTSRSAAFAAERLPISRKWRWKAFERSHASAVRLARLQWIRYHAGPTPMADARRTWLAAELDGMALVGGHGIESHLGHDFRWTEPVAVLRLAPGKDDRLLTVETGGLRGDPASYVMAAYVGHRRIEDWSAEDGRLEFRVRPTEAEESTRHGITLLSRPLRPERHGSSDHRRLGIPIISAEWRPEP